MLAAQPGFKTRALEIFWRWGSSPDAEPKGKKPGFAIAQKFESLAQKHEADFSAEHIAIAREATLATMEEMVFRGTSRDKGAALSYFGSTSSAKLRKLRQQEHDDRVAAKKVEKLAEDEVAAVSEDRQKANAMKLGALATRLETGTAAKRIETSKNAPASMAATNEPSHDRKKGGGRGRDVDRRLPVATRFSMKYRDRRSGKYAKR